MGEQDGVGLAVGNVVKSAHVVAGRSVQSQAAEGAQGRHGARGLGGEQGVNVAVLTARQVLEEQPDGVQCHAVADGVVSGGVHRFDGDAKLADGSGHQDAQRRSRQCLPVDYDGAVRDAVAGDAQLATLLVIGDPTAAAAELGAAHGGGNAENGQLGSRRGRHSDLVRGLEDDGVVADVPALGLQRRNGLGGVMSAAAADADEDIGLGFLGHCRAGLHSVHRRVGLYAGVCADVARAEGFLHPWHHVAGGQDGGTAGDHGPAGA